MPPAPFDSHPTVRAHHARRAAAAGPAGAGAGDQRRPLDEAALRALCLDAGADDVGFVPIDHPDLDDQRARILAVAPWTRTLISIVARMNVEPVRSPARSVANLEFHDASDTANHAAKVIVANLALRGIRALNPAVGFPMEMATFPDRVWVVSHKPVAVAAGLGRVGIHRNVIHPRFGSFILLATILADIDPPAPARPLDFNPCLTCKLCIAACPVGAIAENGFNFASCYTHNYREFMGGFTDWVEQLADSRSAADYRARFDDGESASLWQSLSFGANYKAAYCLAVCPAGEDVIAPFLDDRAGFIRDVVRPLQDKVETLYVSPGSDAQHHAQRRFPHKRIKHVGRVITPSSIRGFFLGMVHVFQPTASAGLDAVFHFDFTGREPTQRTVTIRQQQIDVRDGLLGTPSVAVRADSDAWLRLLRGDATPLGLILRRKLRVRGNPRLLSRFQRCFPR